MVKERKGFTTQDLVGLVLVVVVVFFVVSFLMRPKAAQKEPATPTATEVAAQEKHFKSKSEIEKNFTLTMRVNFAEDRQGRKYLGLRYRIINAGTKAAIIDKVTTNSKGLRFELVDKQGRKFFLPDEKTFIVQGPLKDDVVSLEPGKVTSGLIRVYPEDHPGYAPGEYSAKAFVTVYTKSAKGNKVKMLCKLVSEPVSFFIPNVSQEPGPSQGY